MHGQSLGDHSKEVTRQGPGQRDFVLICDFMGYARRTERVGAPYAHVTRIVDIERDPGIDYSR